MNSKKYVQTVLISTLLMITLFATIIALIDPYFHYHKPLSGLSYPLNNERYQNDGIVKHFDYDTIITGTSITENFKTTEFDSLFGVNSIKTSFQGTGYKEIDQNIRRGISANKNIKYVLRSLDSTRLIADKDEVEKDSSPTYLFDNNLLNDVNYVLNKDVMLNDTYRVLQNTKNGIPTTSFDEYANWNASQTFGRDATLSSYSRSAPTSTKAELSPKEIKMIHENIAQNVIATANENPDITFYLFFPPYSICSWDILYREGKIEYSIAAEQIATMDLLKCNNIKLFSFNNNYSLICDLDNYKDYVHYGEWVNSDMLQWMRNDQYRLTTENVQEYFDSIFSFYTSYDYENISAVTETVVQD